MVSAKTIPARSPFAPKQLAVAVGACMLTASIAFQQPSSKPEPSCRTAKGIESLELRRDARLFGDSCVLISAPRRSIRVKGSKLVLMRIFGKFEQKRAQARFSRRMPRRINRARCVLEGHPNKVPAERWAAPVSPGKCWRHIEACRQDAGAIGVQS